ncbi:hypothetical protein D3C81_1268480 [compost metagenome]
MRGIDEAVRHQKAHVFQAGVDFRCGAGEQQHHTGEKHEDRQHRCSQPGGGFERLLRKQQAPGFVGQQQHTGQQQRQYYIDQAVQQQCGGQWRGAELIGEGCEQNRFEHTDAARHMAKYTGRKRQQIDQNERAKRRGFREQQVKDGSGGGYIQRGDYQLQCCQSCAGQAQRPAPQLHQQAVW